MTCNLVIRKCIIEIKTYWVAYNNMTCVLIIYCAVFFCTPTPNVRQMQHHTLFIALETNYNNCV